MKKLFNHMLVPVDLADDEGIVRQALHMTSRLQCQLHLFYHVPSAHSQEIDSIKADIKQRHPCLTDPSIYLEVNTDFAGPEKQIIDYSKRHGVDLILLVRKKRPGHPLFRHPVGADVDRLVEKSLCPVLSVFEQPSLSSLQKIVLPVGDHLPMRQLLFATYLGRTVNSTIHLVAPSSNDQDIAVGHRGNLHKAYRLLRENTNLSIECLASPEEDLSEAAWNYAKRIKADLILTSPGKECSHAGVWSKFRTKFLNRLGVHALSNTFNIPVMTVSNLS